MLSRCVCVRVCVCVCVCVDGWVCTLCPVSYSQSTVVSEWSKKKQIHTMTDAHEGNVAHMEFLHSQSLLLTAGSDNALKVCVCGRTGGPMS